MAETQSTTEGNIEQVADHIRKLNERIIDSSKQAGEATLSAYKLLVTAQERWRRFNGHELIAEVLDGATFTDGLKVTDDEPTTQDEEVAAC